MNETIRSLERSLGFSLPSFYIVIKAQELAGYYYPPFPPTAPVMITDLCANDLAEKIKPVLLAQYPTEHLILHLYANRDPQYINGMEITLQRRELTIDQLDQDDYQENDILYLYPLGQDSSCESFQNVVAHLRAPDGCPWDRKQTHQSLRSHLLSETYEVLEALDNQSTESLCEELGDLLLQIILHAQIAYEMGEFRMTDVLQGVHQKIVRRHPHVFGSLEVEGVEGVLQNWERLKAAERNARNHQDNEHQPKGLLDGLPAALPALVQAQEFQERANRVGFHYPDIACIKEEVLSLLDKLQNRSDPNLDSQQMLGEVLFSIVSLACQLDVDAESALREKNMRFKNKIKDENQQTN